MPFVQKTNLFHLPDSRFIPPASLHPCAFALNDPGMKILLCPIFLILEAMRRFSISDFLSLVIYKEGDHLFLSCPRLKKRNKHPLY